MIPMSPWGDIYPHFSSLSCAGRVWGQGGARAGSAALPPLLAEHRLLLACPCHFALFCFVFPSSNPLQKNYWRALNPRGKPSCSVLCCSPAMFAWCRKAYVPPELWAVHDRSQSCTMLRSSRGQENNSRAVKISDSRYGTPKLVAGECMWKKVTCKI